MTLQEAQTKVLETLGYGEQTPVKEEVYRVYREGIMKDLDKFIITERIKKAQTAESSCNLTVC
jgi:hypothetical protein